MRQKELLRRVCQYLADHPPESWEGVTCEPSAEYAIFWRFEQGGDMLGVAVLPASIQWERVRAAKPLTRHEIDIVIFGRSASLETLVKIMEGLEDLAEVFMDDGGPVDDTDCMNAGTVNGAKAGYDKSRLFGTGKPFRAGIRLEFLC
jgi:hypothetical protein